MVPGGGMANVFNNCPRLPRPDCTTLHSPAALLAANALEFWTWETHGLCAPARRGRFVLLLFNRLELPRPVRLTVLKYLKRHELRPGV